MNVTASSSIATEPHGEHAGRAAHAGAHPQGHARPISSLVSPDVRRNMIAETAYYRAKQRGFAPGYELDDWLAAESEVDTALTIGVQPAAD